jgi:SAM-dependent methyltransferase
MVAWKEDGEGLEYMRAMKIDSAAQTYIERLYDVPGFFGPLDAALFAQLFQTQDDAGVVGDVLEIGCWYGRAAILLEYLKRDEEVLHVCDLFEDPPPTRSGQMELAASSERMPARSEFEAWFRSFHPTLPVIHQGPSSALSAMELGPNRFRFVHVDGSHTHEAVTQDIAIACELATDGGVVAFDDFANVGHPGVAAALWPAVKQRDLKPFACSPSKLYVTRGSDQAAHYRAALAEFAGLHGSRCKISELPQSSILSVWPTGERRRFRTRVAGRVRRSLHRTLVARRTRRRKLNIPDYTLLLVK